MVDQLIHIRTVDGTARLQAFHLADRAPYAMHAVRRQNRFGGFIDGQAWPIVISFVMLVICLNPLLTAGL